MGYDLILKGGRIFDPGAGLDRFADIGFAEGKVAEIGDGLSGGPERRVEGLLVTPGLIDLHTHVYWRGASLGIDPDAYCRASAATTLVDAGSAGPGNFAGFRAHVIEKAEARILAYLHVSHAGVFAFSDRIMVGESEDIRLMDPVTAAEVAAANRDVIVGIKVRLGRHASGAQGMNPFHHALDAAERAGMPLMVHIDEPPPSYAELCEALRPGDVLTHCFRPFPNSPLGPDGKPRREAAAARARGVLFDIGHGKGSFAFETARAMLAGGFPPDVISTDVHALCIDGPAFDMQTTMSKFLALGMGLDEVVRRSTAEPARAIRRPDLGTLAPGAAGDAAVLALEAGAFPLTDVTGETVTAPERLFVRGTVLGGRWLDAP